MLQSHVHSYISQSHTPFLFTSVGLSGMESRIKAGSLILLATFTYGLHEMATEKSIESLEVAIFGGRRFSAVTMYCT